jgi:hypothetical protein
MNKLFLVLFFISHTVFAGVDDKVLITGKIGKSFNENTVRVIDSFDQEYELPKSSFPKEFKFHTGKVFSIEVDEEVISGIKIKKKSS